MSKSLPPKTDENFACGIKSGWDFTVCEFIENQEVHGLSVQGIENKTQLFSILVSVIKIFFFNICKFYPPPVASYKKEILQSESNV